MGQSTFTAKDFYSRLKEWAKAPDGDQELNAVVKATGLPYTTVRSWKIGPALPNLGTVLEFCEGKDVDPIWLLFGIVEGGSTAGEAEESWVRAHLPRHLQAKLDEIWRDGTDERRKALKVVVEALLSSVRGEKASEQPTSKKKVSGTGA